MGVVNGRRMACFIFLFLSFSPLEATAQPKPIIELETGGKAAILNYTVSEPTAYTGRHFITLDVDPSWFRQDAFLSDEVTATPSSGVPATEVSSSRAVERTIQKSLLGGPVSLPLDEETTLRTEIKAAMKSGFSDR